MRADDRSFVTTTSVTLTQWLRRGSRILVAMISATSRCMRWATRSGRILTFELSWGGSSQALLLPVDHDDVRPGFHDAAHRLQQLVDLAVLAGHHRDAERRALPQILMIHFRHRGGRSLANPVLERAHHRALVLQRRRSWNVQLEPNDSHEHGVIPAGPEIRACARGSSPALPP